MTRTLAAAAFALLIGGHAGAVRADTAAATPQFSADIVDTRADGSKRPLGESGKLYVSGGKIRIDRADASGTNFLIDADQPSAYVVAPAERLYMDAKQSSLLTELFVPVDPASPCAAWQAMAKLAGDTGEDGSGIWQCLVAEAPDEVDGREAAKVTLISPRGAVRTGWIDATLHFLVRLETPDGAAIVLHNIVPAPQPDRLFALPSGLRKYDPAQLLARVKQSDVWVEPVQQ
jgi:hypothetical protein